MTNALRELLKPIPTLKRYPTRSHEILQAWDSADELMLKHVSGLNLQDRRILIVNDSFGALSCALEHFSPTVYTDSYLSKKGIELNSEGRVQALNNLEDLSGKYDLVLIRIPKNQSFLEEILCHLTQHLHADSNVICGYMIKHQANSSFDLLAKYIGETTTSLAQKKARLIFAQFEKAAVASPYPIQVEIEGFKLPFTHHSNLFSREKLDIGTRFFLEHLPLGDYETILDLGCANGILGIAAKKLNPRARIIFTDESWMAIRSARACFEAHFPGEVAQYHWTHSCEGLKPGMVDLVLCNPPFHQGNTIGDSVAKQMFKDSITVLKPGGSLRLIGNRHLEYGALIRKYFGNSVTIATNSKFTIVDALKKS